MTDTQLKPGDKVVLLERFDFYLNGIGLDVPVHGKVYCVAVTGYTDNDRPNGSREPNDGERPSSYDTQKV